MTRACRFTFGDRVGAGEWTFDGEHLTLSPEGGSLVAVALSEIAGIAGDGYTVDVVLPGDGQSCGSPVPGAAPVATPNAPSGVGPGAGGTSAGTHLVLSRLGSDGPTLLEELRRTWLTARAEVLRLGGSGEGKRFYGHVSGLTPGAPEVFQGLLFEDVLVVAREGWDLDPLFLALFEGVAFDEASYSIRVRQWPGREIVFSKMARQTDEFVQALQGNRALLAAESAALLASVVPSLPAGGRAALAGLWLPGRLAELGAMDSVCKGFGGAFEDGWLPRLPRLP